MDQQSDDATTSTEPTTLLSAAQNHDAKISLTTRSPNRRANAHSLFPTESYDEEQYDIDTSIDTIWVNTYNSVLAHYSSNGKRVSDDAWSKLPQDSWNIWMSLPIDDWKLILGASNSVSSITETFSSTPSRSGLGRGRRTFARNRDKRKVMFMDQQLEDATTSTKPTTDSTDDDLVDDIMGQFDFDFDTLCVHVAEHKHEELKAEGKHPHHRPTKRTANPVVAPPGDVRRLLGDKVKTIGGIPYEVKCAGTTPTPTDVDIDGIVYSVKMADCVYCVSTNNHSEATGALIDRGANGGLQGTTVES
jgi:hypothetical protein